MRLQDYPKPQDDNGRGVHWIPFTWGQVTNEHKRITDELYVHLRDMNMRWVLILNGTGQEWRANEYLVRKLIGPNPARPEIMPIIRIGTHFHPQALERRARGEMVGLDLQRVREIVTFYRSLGVPYFQLYNEPNHIDEWPDRIVPLNAPEICVALWLDAALATLDAGGLPGFMPLAPGASWPGGDDLVMLAAMMDQIHLQATIPQRQRLLDKMWIGIHNYFLHRPILSLPADSHGFKKFIWYEGIVREKLGRELPLLTGEGGLRMGPPPYGDNANEAQVAAATKEACRYMGRAPAYYFCNCLWLLGSAIGGGSDAWEAASWFRKNGDRQEVVTALKRLGEFERNPEPAEERFFYRNGYAMNRCHMVKQPFLDEFNALGGVGYCGYPTSGEVLEGDLTIQGFEKLTLERLPNGTVQVRGAGPRQITLTIPHPRALLREQLLATRDVEQALSELETLYGPADQLVAGEYQVQISGQANWRNQDVINAFWIAGGRVGFELMDRAGLSVSELAQDRQGAYAGPTIDTLPNLTSGERERLLVALPPLSTRLITLRIPSAYALLEAQGLDSATMSQVLHLLTTEYGPPELLGPGEYAIALPVEPSLPVVGTYTNQDIINAFWTAGNQTWDLLNKAGLNLADLVADRQGAFQGPAIDDMMALSTQEKAWVKAALPPKIAAPQTMPIMAVAPLQIDWQPLTANWTAGRQGRHIDLILIQSTHSSLSDALARANQPLIGRAPHYLIAKSGRIIQLVRAQDTANHTRMAQYTLRETRIQPNARGIAIALANWGLTPNDAGDMDWDPYTTEQYASLWRLVRHLCATYGIPLAYPPRGPSQYAPTEQLAYFRGVLAASALDPDQPSSPGPAFDWDPPN